MVAGILMVAASSVDRETDVDIYSSGGTIEVQVAGSTLAAPVSMQNLTTIEISAMDSIDPPRARRLTVSGRSGTTRSFRIPRAASFSRRKLVPVGDWSIDEACGRATIAIVEVSIDGPFTVRGEFAGRALQDLVMTLRGDETFSVAVRRGLINNDMFLRNAQGDILASGSIDPTPWADLGAIAALLARALAIAALLLGSFTLLARFRVQWRADSEGRCRSHSRYVWITILTATGAAAVLSTWVSAGVLERLPHTPDAATYLLQARWLLDGKLWGEVAPWQDLVTVPFTYVDGDRWLAHYPAGWPAVLALGLAVGLPWLVNPLLGGLFSILVFLLGRELDGPLLGVGAALLALVSPMVRLMFGCQLSHGAAAVLVLAAVYFAITAQRKNDPVFAVLSGFAVGLSFGIRPVTAVATAIPIGLYLAHGLIDHPRRRASGAVLGAFVGAGALASIPTMIANHLITGSCLRFPYTLAAHSMYAFANIPFGIRNADALIASTCASLFGWGWDLVHGPWVLASGLALAAIPFLCRRARPTDHLMLALVVTVVLAHLGTRGHGLHGFGPRYYFEIFAFLILLSARGFSELARVGGRVTDLPAAASAALFGFLTLLAAFSLPDRLILYQGYNRVDGALERQMGEVHEPTILVLTDEGWRGWARAVPLMVADRTQDLVVVAGDVSDLTSYRELDGREVLVWGERRLASAGCSGPPAEVDQSTGRGAEHESRENSAGLR